MKISVCKDSNINALSKWEEIEVKKYKELVNCIKQYPYSVGVFKDDYRKGENVVGFHNVIIFDIDNDKDMPELKIKEAEQLLKQHNISSIIITSKSHNIDKNGHISQRYRIIIPTNKGIDNVDKETYKEFQNLTAKALKLDEYVDKKALNDKARFYYKSPATAEIIIIKSDRVMNIDNLQKKAKENVLNKQKIKEAEQQKNKEIKENIQTIQKEVNNNNLTYANTEKIMQLDIKQLIIFYEKNIDEYRVRIHKRSKSETDLI